MLLVGLVAGAIGAAAGAYVAFDVGRKVERGEHVAAELSVAQATITRLEIIEREVPKIVREVAVQTVTINTETERVIREIPDLLDPDCILPDRWGMLLVAAANGWEPNAPGDPHGIAGTYGCREVLAATLKDHAAGRTNTARLAGLQRWELLTRDSTPRE